MYWFVRSVNLIVARGFFGPKQRFVLPRREMPTALATQYDLELLRELDPEFAAYLQRRGISHYQMLRHYRRFRELQDEPIDPDPDNQAS